MMDHWSPRIQHTTPWMPNSSPRGLDSVLQVFIVILLQELIGMIGMLSDCQQN